MAIDPSVIGTELPTFTSELERGRIRSFARVIGETDPVFSDVGAARAQGHPDLPAPPTLLFGFLLEQPDSDAWFTDLGFDIANVLHAEQTFIYRSTAHAGDELTFTPRIVDTFEKKGGALQFLVRETMVTRQDGSPVVEQRETLALLRPLEAGASS